MDSNPLANDPPAPLAFPEDSHLRAAPPATPSQAVAGESVLETGLQYSPGAASGGHPSPLERFLNEPSPGRALCHWLGLDDRELPCPDRAEATRRITRDIARIDTLLSAQVNAILHHPAFQKLEASWRGLQYLVSKLPDDTSVKVRILPASWGDLVQDLTRALEFDQSQLFRKVYETEFGHPGGEPFGVLLGDFEIRQRQSAEHPYDDIDAVSKVSGIAAAAFAPFISGVHPSFFGLDSFTELERSIDLARALDQVDYVKWKALRQTEDARFVGLTLPRVIMRLPYESAATLGTGFDFREDVSGPDRSKYLWGNAVYAFGGVLIRCFTVSSWVADIRGIRHGPDERGAAKSCLDEGGLVSGLPAHAFSTDPRGVAVKCSTDVIITDAQEKDFDELGFISLCHCYDTEFSAFYGNQSVQKPAKFDDPKATANARLSSMLQYMFCVSRFAHFIKVMSRDKIGSTAGPEEVEDQLQRWLQNYVTASDGAGQEVKARYPLREAKVQVSEHPGLPGTYRCVIHLRPHFQLDQMFTSMRFTTELAQGRAE